MADDFGDIPPQYSKQALENAQKLRDLDEAGVTFTREQAEAAQALRDEFGNLEGAVNGINRERTKLNASELESIKNMEKTNNLHREAAANLAEQSAIAKDDLAIQQKKLDYLIQQAMVDGEITDEEKEQIDAQKEIVKGAKKTNEEFEKAAAHLKDAAKAAKDLAGSFDTMLSGKGDFKESMDVDSLIGGFKGLLAMTYDFEASLKTISTGIFKSFIDNIKDLAFELHDSEAAFRKATGLSQEYSQSVTSTYKANRKFGVSVEEANAAMASLAGTYTDWTMSDKTTRDSIAKTGQILQELGVSNQDFAQGMQNSTKLFGQSGMEAEKTMRGLVAHAKDLGVAPEKMASEFAAAGGQLAQFGKQGVKAFKDLQHISKITGMEMNKILNITSQFDTFESAAEQTGKLNAALGGNFVNAMDMMMETDPAERFKMVRDAISEAGLSFDDMSYYQQKMYTESLGLSDVSELAMVMAGEMDSLQGNMGKNSDELVAMQKAARTTASFQEKLNMMFAEMIPIIEPLIQHLFDFSMWLVESGPMIKEVVGGLMSIVGALIAVTGVLDRSTGLFMGLVGIMLTTEDGAKNIYAEFVKFFEVFDPLVVAFKEMIKAMGLMDEESKAVEGSNELLMKSLEGTLWALGAIVKLISAFLIPAMELLGTVTGTVIKLFTTTMTTMEALKEMGTSVADAFVKSWGLLEVLFDMTGQSIWDVAIKIKNLGFLLFDFPFASTFLEGINKLADAFRAVTSAVREGASPLDTIKNVFKSVGDTIFETFEKSFSMVTTFFETLLSFVDKLMAPINTVANMLATVFENLFDPTTFTSMAESIASITGAISEMPVTKALSFTASMAAFGEAGNAMATMPEAAAPVATPALGATALENTTATVVNTSQVIVKTDGGGTQAQAEQMKVSIKLDGMDLAKFLQGTVVDKLGELSRNALIG